MEDERFELELLLEQLFAKVIRLFRSCREENLAYMMRFYNLIRKLIVYKLPPTSEQFVKLCDMVEVFNKTLTLSINGDTCDLINLSKMIENIEKYIDSDCQTIIEPGKHLNANKYIISILVENKKILKDMFNNLN